MTESRRSRERADPFGLLALAGAGTIAAHELGYFVAPGDVSVSHRHLSLLAPVVVMALCVTAWMSAVRILRTGGAQPPSLGLLAGVQVALYLALEVGERVVLGDLASLLSAPVLLGLALQPAIAGIAVVLLRVGEQAILTWFGPTAAWPARPGLPPAIAPVPVFVPARRAGGVRLRGPPSV